MKRLEDAAAMALRVWLGGVWVVAGLGAVAILVPMWAASSLARRLAR